VAPGYCKEKDADKLTKRRKEDLAVPARTTEMELCVISF